MSDRKKARHEMCVDKTSCKSEMESHDVSSVQAMQPSVSHNPTGHGTKDVIKQQYIQSRQNQSNKN